MIAHSLGSVRSSNLFDKIHVSTDSKVISDVVSTLGFEPEFLRPEHLSDDHTPIMPVLKYVLETYLDAGEAFDVVTLIMPCAPMLEARDLINAMKTFDENDGKYLCLSIAEYPVPIEWAFKRSASGTLLPVDPGSLPIRSQDISPHYFDAGLFTIYPSHKILGSEGAGDYGSYLGYVVPQHKGIDIDTEDDWLLAEAIFSSQHR